MKKSILLLAFSITSAYLSLAQDSTKINMSCLIAGGGYNFKIIGQESGEMVDSLFANFPKEKRNGYVWKFKKVIIPGLEEAVTLQVHQGLYGKGENCSSYFNTFTSEGYKAKRLAQNLESEKPAIIIYVKQGRKNVLITKQQAKIVEEYLLSVYG